MAKFDYTRAGSLDADAANERVRLSRQRLMDSERVLADGARSGRLANSARAWQVWAVCVCMTATFRKGSDKTAARFIADQAGLRTDKVTPILRAFTDEGIFIWTPPTGRGLGLLSLPGLDTEVKADRYQAPSKDRPSSSQARNRRKCSDCGSTSFEPEPGDRGTLQCAACKVPYEEAA